VDNTVNPKINQLERKPVIKLTPNILIRDKKRKVLIRPILLLAVKKSM